MSLYSALTQVLAPFAAKIKGIQTGYDGTEYNSPGEAVREQINALHVLIGDEPGTAIDESVKNWLDTHPEATTSVQDGAITKAKLSESVQQIVGITNAVAYNHYTLDGAKAAVTDRSGNIATLLNTLLSMETVTEVRVFPGNYTFETTVNIPEGKALVLSGDYHNPGESPAIITPASADMVMVKLNSKSVLYGGVYQLGANANVTVVQIDVFNQGVENAVVRNTKILGGRESAGVLSQVGIKVECDDLTETTTEHGYLSLSEFDAYIDSVGYAYHFHRQRASGTTSGVWLTENDIYGYIRHCTRYVFYDMATSDYANNSSIMGATVQAGSLVSGESNYPGINVKGNNLLITGKMWDFTISHQYPAVYFEQSAVDCFAFRSGNVESYRLSNNFLTRNSSLTALIRMTHFKPIPVTLSEDAVANGYITDLSNRSYRIGSIIYLAFNFKIAAQVPSGTALFVINEDAFIINYTVDIIREANGVSAGKLLIYSASPHNVIADSQLSVNSAWMTVRAVCVSNIVTSFKL